VPFTTPLLAGARVRDGKQLELVVPNLSGAKGIHVLQWSNVREFCKPTVHDTVLYRRIATLPQIDPASVRTAGLEIARQGHAGREAMAAADMLLKRDQAQKLQAYGLLIAQLIRQMGTASVASVNGGGPDDLPASALSRVALSMGRSVTELEAAIAAFSGGAASVGIVQEDRLARVPLLLDRLKATCISLSQWVNKDSGNDIVGLGLPLVAAIKATHDTGEAVLAVTRSLLGNPVTLLRRWFENPAGMLPAAWRCDWFLDGWERVCLLWLMADSTASRRASLLEMAQLLPVLPTEVEDWTDVPVPEHALYEACRVTSQNDSWRTGNAAFALVQRNETFRAQGV
jgi:hypothetical protein